MSAEEQKRSHERLKRPFLVKIKKTSSPGWEKWDVVTLRNVSPGGLSFNYTQKFPLETILELDIGLSAGRIQCFGTVCRVDEIPPKSQYARTIPVYGIAVKFKDLPNEKKEVLEKLIRELQV